MTYFDSIGLMLDILTVLLLLAVLTEGRGHWEDRL